MKVDKYYKWWVDDYNPLDGRLRFVFYSLLFYFGYRVFIPSAVDRLAACPESYFAAAGILQFLVPSGLNPQDVAAFMIFTKPIIIFFWICSAVGLFGRIAPAITALSVFIFWGMMQSCAGTGHDWHLPMYSLIFLALFSKNDKWSADYWLSTKLEWYPFRDFSSNKYGGLARKLILLTTVFILFAGGIAKLFTGGFAWMNGESLFYYLKEFNEPALAIGPFLLDFFLEHAWIITILAVWTVILELSSIFILFTKKWRLFYVVNLWAFHIGIYLLMFPRYFPSMICYLLIVNWRYTFNLADKNFGRYISKVPLYKNVSPMLRKSDRVKETTVKNKKIRRTIIPTIVSILFIATILFRIESFPLTYVPMYTTILSEDKIGNYERADFQDRQALHKVAEQYNAGEQPWYFMFYYPRNIEIRLWHRETPDSEIQVKDVTDEYKFLIQNWPKWMEVVTEVTLADIANRKLLYENGTESPTETEEMLREIRSIMENRGGYEHIEKIALIYHFGDEDEEVMMQLE